MLLAPCSAVKAQQPKKVPRIGYLSPNDPTSDSSRSEPIRLALRELGYLEGQNIAFEYRYAEGKVDRFPELAAELVRLKVNVIVAGGGARLVLAAKNAIKTIPIVMVGAGVDPVGAGFVESLARPGGNVTGLTTLSRELGGKRLELLKEAVPKVARVAVLYDAASPGIALDIKEVLQVAARALGLTLQPWEVRRADDFEKVFAGVESRVGGVEKNMNRKITGLALCSMLLAPCSALAAQQAGKIFRIGYLDNSTASGIAVLLDAFRQELSKLGWIEGKNITIEYRFAEQKLERLPELAADLVRLKVDLIVASGGPTPLAAKKATSTIPIVMATSPDPVAAGLVASLASPGGNITGLSDLGPELNSKRLEILKDAIPRLSRVGLLRTPGGALGSDPELLMKELRPAALALKIRLEEIKTQTDAKDLESAFKTAKQKQVNAIMTAPGSRLFAERKRIVDFAGKYRLPAIYPNKGYVDEGGLMSYGVDYDDLYRRAAVYVDKILKGAKPADLPVQQATKFEFVINLKAAKQIGLTIPPEVLARANRVIK
jgi:putative tryptophan/tyrosine transport system substrate-binding protein